MKYYILGAGYLGTRLSELLPGAVLSPVRVGNVRSLAELLRNNSPDFVVNCCGKTGGPPSYNVDWCETHKSETFYANSAVPLIIYGACKQTKVKMIHIGTGCVYNGTNNGEGFTEEDPPNYFGSVYSRSKLISENILKEFPVLQLRIRMPIDEVVHERNLLSKLLKYDKIIDVPNSVTIVRDLAFVLDTLADLGATGIYNVVNPGEEYHGQLLSLFNLYSSRKKRFEIYSVADLEAECTAGRSNTLLNTDKLSKAGFRFGGLYGALDECVKKYVAELEAMNGGADGKRSIKVQENGSGSL